MCPTNLAGELGRQGQNIGIEQGSDRGTTKRRYLKVPSVSFNLIATSQCGDVPASAADQRDRALAHHQVVVPQAA